MEVLATSSHASQLFASSRTLRMLDNGGHPLMHASMVFDAGPEDVATIMTRKDHYAKALRL